MSRQIGSRARTIWIFPGDFADNTFPALIYELALWMATTANPCRSKSQILGPVGQTRTAGSRQGRILQPPAGCARDGWDTLSKRPTKIPGPVHPRGTQVIARGGERWKWGTADRTEQGYSVRVNAYVAPATAIAAKPVTTVTSSQPG